MASIKGAKHPVFRSKRKADGGAVGRMKGARRKVLPKGGLSVLTFSHKKKSRRRSRRLFCVKREIIPP